MSDVQKNVLGEDLELCGSNPITGYLRAVSYTHLRAHETS